MTDEVPPVDPPPFIPESETEEPAPSVTQVAQEVLAGQWGRGHRRRQKLSAAGWNVDDVMQEVNRILKGV